jgi:hypothetical protein
VSLHQPGATKHGEHSESLEDLTVPVHATLLHQQLDMGLPWLLYCLLRTMCQAHASSPVPDCDELAVGQQPHL